MTLIKSISGIRGTVGGAQAGNLTPPDVVKFTTAYARLAARRKAGKKLTIVVGRDARISGEMVADLVEGTLLACGADVINVGLCTTPGVEMAVITHKADGGIIITASHNPRQWNALKLLNAEGEFLSDAEGKRVLALDMASMVACTKYRGDFEERFKNLLEELYRDRSTILFIDEIHVIAGAGAAEGAIDAASILKPMLARGEIQLIGATTPVEYRKSIQKDSALDRRFGMVNIEEPAPQQAEKI